MFSQNTLSSVSSEQLEALVSMIKEEIHVRKQNPKTLEGFKEEYLEYSNSQFSKSYVKSIELSFKHMINYFGRYKMLNDFSVKNAEDFIRNLKINAPSGFKVYYRNLKASFTKAIEWEYIKSNPFKKITMMRRQVNKPTFIDKDELNKIISFEKNPVLKLIYLITFYTGLRLHEVINLRTRNINYDDNLITVGDENFTTKSRRQRIIPICSDLDITKSHLTKNKDDPDHFLFTKDNGFPYTPEYVSKRFKKACRLAGMDEKVHFHTLRHSFASHLAQKNVPMVDIKELMGHSNISTTEIYAHTSLKNLQNAVSRLNN
jgi:integrase/recombinase XerD